MNLRRNVLIFHAGALGDFVLSWPLAMALGRLYPQSRIVYVTRAQKGALAERLLGVESRDIESGWHQLFSETPKLDESCAKLLAGAHSIFDFVSTGKPLWATNVKRLNPEAKILSLQARPESNYAKHATDFLLEELASDSVVQDATHQMIASIQDRGIAARVEAEPTIVLHPGSGSIAKCWPIDSWINLIEQLRVMQRRVHVLLGEVERERLTADEKKRLAAVAKVYEPTTYLDLLSHLSAASLFIGHDTGPAHLAGVLGVPTLCLFGPTNDAVWRPMGPRVKVIHHEPLAALGANQVFAAAVAMVGR